MALGLQLVDGRELMGASVWAKPAKFGASIALAAPMLGWIIGQLEGRRARRAGSIISVMAALELVLITVQATRGVPSHFANTSLFEGVIFTVMGVGIAVFWGAELYLGVRAFRQPFGTSARTWGIRFGLGCTLLGGALGFIMPIPTAAQREQLAAGERPALVGAHAVGVPDGGPGLPVTRWSTEGGDLRVPHFFGLHALQALPLAAWLFERRRREAATRRVAALGVAWLGLTLVTLWQALRGQPLLAPDALTLGAAFAVLAAAAVVAFAAPAKLRMRAAAHS